jgi:hypothetical protein
MPVSEFVEGVACGSLLSFGFAEAFTLQNLNLLGTDGILFLFTFEDPTRSLPDEVHAKINAYSVQLRSSKGQHEIVDKWSWASLGSFFVGKRAFPRRSATKHATNGVCLEPNTSVLGKSPRKPDDMETFYLVHSELGQVI